MDRARNIFYNIESKGCGHDTIAYTTMIDRYGKIDRRDEALSLFKEMTQKGLTPDSTMYNILKGLRSQAQDLAAS